jgi:hypothetical protein
LFETAPGAGCAVVPEWLAATEGPSDWRVTSQVISTRATAATAATVPHFMFLMVFSVGRGGAHIGARRFDAVASMIS